MAKISHTKIKQPSFGEKRPKLTYTKISRFTVSHTTVNVSSAVTITVGWRAAINEMSSFDRHIPELTDKKIKHMGTKSGQN